jgi:hypothetical protein
MRKNPTRATHERMARTHMAVAENYERMAEGSVVKPQVLILAHCEACKAVEHARLSGNEVLRHQAADVATRVGPQMAESNPYERKTKAKFATQGTPWPQTWEYGEWKLVVGPHERGRYVVNVYRPGFPSSDTYYLAASPESALERGRLYADRIEYLWTLSEEKQRDFITMDAGIESAIRRLAAEGALNRANVAREIEQGRRGAAGSALSGASEPFRFFHELSLKDRLKWIDSLIKDYKLEKELPNPRPKRKRPTKATTRAERRSILRRLLRL